MSTPAIEDGENRAPHESDAPTTEVVAGAAGGRCPNCQAPLASDQRYCVNCGTRRGAANLPTTPVATQEPSVAAASHSAPPSRPRMSSAASLIAGVATLLIALGVGVLIGHYSSNNAPAKNAGLSVLTVGSGGSTGAVNPTAPAQATHPSKAAKASLAKANKPVIVHLTPKVQAKAAAAASKVFGTNGNLAKNPTQQVGQSCTSGAGCQNGKFTGNFFSP